MCSARGALVAATTVGVVEALKDQGYCRWNNVARSMQQHAKKQIRSSSSQAKRPSPPSSSSSSLSAVSKKLREEKMNKSEESLRTVMYLSCWGPNC